MKEEKWLLARDSLPQASDDLAQHKLLIKQNKYAPIKPPVDLMHWTEKDLKRETCKKFAVGSLFFPRNTLTQSMLFWEVLQIA